MESSVLPGLLPGISAETHVSMAQAGYLAFAYSVTYAIAAPVLSALFGAADRRKVLASAELIFALSAACIAIAPGLPLMIAARVCLACGAAMFTSMAQATAVAITPPERRGRAMALVLTGATLATAAGSPVGAWIAVQFSWRATIGLVALFGFVAAAI